MPSLIVPPADGSLILPDILQFNLTHNPAIPFYYFSQEGSNLITEISHLEFVQACHRVAHVLRPKREGEDGRVIAIIANVDTILYQTVVMGIILAGLVVSIRHLVVVRPIN